MQLQQRVVKRMRKIFAFILSALLVSSVLVSAADFTLTTQNYNADICRGSTSTITTQVTTAGSGSFSVSAKGSAGAFTTSVPESFSLDANGKQSIYSYVNPPSTAKEGAYTLILEVNSDGEVKSETYNINVKDCHGSSLSVDIGSRLSCSCEKVTYSLNLVNNGKYVEAFDISVDGAASKWANLSTNLISLSPGEKRAFSATVSPACEVYGDYDLTFKAKSRNSLSSSTTSTSLKINPCYEYSVVAPSENMTVCEGKATEVPLTLRNTGTARNTFTLSAGGPNWAYFRNATASAEAGSDAVVNLTFNPAKSTDGKPVDVTIRAVSSTGSVEKTSVIKTIVETCYSILLETNKQDYICDLDESYAFDLNVENLGKDNEAVELQLDAPEWVSLSDSTFVITARKNRSTGIIVKVPIKTGLGTYPISINAKSDHGATASTKKELVLAEPEACYSSSLDTEDKKSELNTVIESGKTFTLSLENKGLDTATYLIELKGNATDFSTINPTKVEVSPGKSEKLYLYISPPLFTQMGAHDLTVVARAKGTDVSSSVILKVNVVNESLPDVLLEEDSTEESKPGFFSRLWSKFLGLFQKSEKTEVANEEANLTISLSNESEGDDAPTQENSESLNLSSETEEANNSAVEDEVQEETLESTQTADEDTQETQNGTFAANETLPSLEASNTEDSEEEEENSSAADTNSTVLTNNSVQSDENNVTINGTGFKRLDLSDLEAESEQKKFDLKEYGTYLFGAATIVAVVLLLVTGWSKKIIDFFEGE